jgi:hypothetical protein
MFLRLFGHREIDTATVVHACWSRPTSFLVRSDPQFWQEAVDPG